MSTMDLRASVTSAPELTVLVTLEGEMDATSTPTVMNLITSAVDIGKPTVTLDLSGVTFIDSEGLAALLAAERLTDGAGMLLVLRSPSRRVMDLLLLSGLDWAFSIETTVVPLAEADDSNTQAMWDSRSNRAPPSERFTVASARS